MIKSVIHLLFLCLGCQISFSQAPLIVNHLHTNLEKVPLEYIRLVSDKLNIAYGHTSHGSQVMRGLSSIADKYGSDFEFSSNPLALGVEIFEGDGYGDGLLDHDAGYYPAWENETREFLNMPENARFNVLIWSWCGQLSGYSSQQVYDRYLLVMNQLEADFPGVTFVYMTGHLDGSGVNGQLHLNNELIRDYCLTNNKVLYDFADIESFDPDGVNYLEKMANDGCSYDGDNDGARESNWAEQWCNANPEACFYSGSCSHTQSLNCQLKGSAMWWLMAQLSGWKAGSGIDDVLMAQHIGYWNMADRTFVLDKIGNLGAPNVYFQLYSILGHKIFSKIVVGDFEGRIDLSFIESGVYVLSVGWGDQQIVQKIVVP